MELMTLTLCEFSIETKWILIYRTSQDGFGAAQFHSNCDYKPNTLVLIKSENGYVFGGYTKQSWHCNNNNNCENYFKNDQNAFIFSMINQRNKYLKMSRESIYCHNDFGPVFGNDDFYIVDKSNTNAKSCSKLVNSYAHPDYARN